MIEFLTSDWLGTAVWFWLVFLAIVIALTAFDLGVLHRDNREIGLGESFRLSAFYIGVAMALFSAMYPVLTYIKAQEILRNKKNQ